MTVQTDAMLDRSTWLGWKLYRGWQLPTALLDAAGRWKANQFLTELVVKSAERLAGAKREG